MYFEKAKVTLALAGLSVLWGVACTSHSSQEASPSPAPIEPAQEPSAFIESSLVQMEGQQLPITAEADLAGHTIELEVAQTRQQQRIGLMHREQLSDNRGMLFPFEPARPVRFWMKNVLIPLDMVFVYQGTVVEIASQVPPCEAEPCPTYGPRLQPVDQVIELRGGRAAELGLQVGDPVDIRWR